MLRLEYNVLFLTVILYGGFQGGVVALPAPAEAPTGAPDFCSSTMPEDVINMTIACIKKLNIKELNVDNFSPDLDRAVDPNFDDQCLAKCVFTESKLMTEDGEPIPQAFKDDIQTLHPENHHGHLANITESCLSFTAQQFAAAGGAKSAPCKYAATLAQCLATEEFKLCHPTGTK